MEQSLRSWGDRWNEPITRSGQYRVSWSTTARSHRASSFPLACRFTASRSYYHFAGLRAADATVRDQEVANILYSPHKTQGYLRRGQKKRKHETFLKKYVMKWDNILEVCTRARGQENKEKNACMSSCYK